jgi:hypothetical protein
MAHSNAFNTEQNVSAPGNGRSLLTPIGPTHSSDGHGHLSGGYSPEHGHYTDLNGISPNNQVSKHGIKRKRSIVDAAHRHNSEDSYTDNDGPGGSSVHGKSQFSAQPKLSSAQQQAEAKKRTKTQRACDKCRTKKIRYTPHFRSVTVLNPGIGYPLPFIDATSCRTRNHPFVLTASSTTTIAPSFCRYRRRGLRKREPKRTLPSRFSKGVLTRQMAQRIVTTPPAPYGHTVRGSYLASTPGTLITFIQALPPSPS